MYWVYRSKTSGQRTWHLFCKFEARSVEVLLRDMPAESKKWKAHCPCKKASNPRSGVDWPRKRYGVTFWPGRDLCSFASGYDVYLPEGGRIKEKCMKALWGTTCIRTSEVQRVTPVYLTIMVIDLLTEYRFQWPAHTNRPLHQKLIFLKRIRARFDFEFRTPPVSLILQGSSLVRSNIATYYKSILCHVNTLWNIGATWIFRTNRKKPWCQYHSGLSGILHP